MKKTFLFLISTVFVTLVIYSCADDIVFKETQGIAQPPGAPIQVGVDNVTAESLDLYWSEPLFRGTLPGGGDAVISYYNVQYSRNSDFSLIESEESVNPPDEEGARINFNATPLLPNTQYYFRVKAINNNDSDAQKSSSEYRVYDNGKAVTTKSAEEPPGTPQNLKFANFGQTSFDVSWTPPLDTGKRPDGKPALITGYIVEWDVNSDFTSSDKQAITTTRISYPVSNLLSNKDYYVRVYAINDNRGNNTTLEPLSNSSNPVKTLSLEKKPDSPTNIRVIKTEKTSVTISFDRVSDIGFGTFPDGKRANLDRYDILLSESDLFTNATPSPSSTGSGVIIKDLTPGTVYYLRVRAVNNNLGTLNTDTNNPFRFSDWTDFPGIIRTVSDSEKPDKVTNVRSSNVGATTATIAWQKPISFGKRNQGSLAKLINYRVRISLNSNFTGASTGFSTEETFDAENLTPFQDYYVEVVAISDSDDPANAVSDPEYLNGSPTSFFRTISAETSPASPRDVIATNISQRTISLRWQASPQIGSTITGGRPNFLGYRILYSKTDPTLTLSSTGATDTKEFPSNNTYIDPTAATLPNLDPNQKYYIGIVARNSNPSIHTSTIALVTNNIDGSVVTRSAVTPPETPINLNAIASTKNSLNVEWQISNSPDPTGLRDNGTPATLINYILQISESSNFIAPVEYTASPTTNTYVFSGLSPNRDYYIQVRANSDNQTPNDLSPWSSYVQIRTQPDAKGPDSVPLFGPNLTVPNARNSLSVSWLPPINPGTDVNGQVSSLVSYRVYYSLNPTINYDTTPYKLFSSSDSSGTIDGGSSTFQGGSAPTPGERYYMAIYAINSEGLSSPQVLYNSSGNSYAETASAEERPSNVTNATALPGPTPTELDLTFRAPSRSGFGKDEKGVEANLVRFDIYYSENESDVTSNLGSATKRQLTYNITNPTQAQTIAGLNPSTEYFFAIFSVNDRSSGVSGDANTSDPTYLSGQTSSNYIAPQPPLTFTIIGGTITSSSAKLELTYDPNDIGFSADGLTPASGQEFIIDIDSSSSFANLGAQNPNLAQTYSSTVLRQRVVIPYNVSNVSTPIEYEVSGLEPDRTYYARIYASNDNPNNSFSKYSSVKFLSGFSFKTVSAESAPTFAGRMISDESLRTSSAVGVQFQAFFGGLDNKGNNTDIASYIISTDTNLNFNSPDLLERAYNSGFPTSGTVNLQSNTGLRGNTEYYVKVVGINRNVTHKVSLDFIYQTTIKTKTNYLRPEPPSSFTVPLNSLPRATEIDVLFTSAGNPGRDAQGTNNTVQEYEIFVSTTPDNTITATGAGSGLYQISLAQAQSVIQTLTPHSITGLSPATPYYMWIRTVAGNASGSDRSAYIPITDSSNLANPSAPFVRTTSAATRPEAPALLRIESMSSNSSSLVGLNTSLVSLSWLSSPLNSLGHYGFEPNGVIPITQLSSYVIQIASDSNFTQGKKEITIPVTSTSPTNLQRFPYSSASGDFVPGANYYVRVAAVNSNPTEATSRSDYSNVIRLTAGDARPSGIIELEVKTSGGNAVIGPNLAYFSLKNPAQVSSIFAGVRGGENSLVTAELIIEYSTDSSFPAITTQSVAVNSLASLTQLPIYITNLSPITNYHVRTYVKNNNDPMLTDDSSGNAAAPYISNRGSNSSQFSFTTTDRVTQVQLNVTSRGPAGRTVIIKELRGDKVEIDAQGNLTITPDVAVIPIPERSSDNRKIIGTIPIGFGTAYDTPPFDLLFSSVNAAETTFYTDLTTFIWINTDTATNRINRITISFQDSSRNRTVITTVNPGTGNYDADNIVTL